MDPIPEALQLFWDKGIKQVSPGALGMTVEFNGKQRGRPYDDKEGEVIANSLSFAKWVNGWIILERELNASNS